MSFQSEKSHLGSELQGSANSFEGDVRGAVELRGDAQARVSRVRGATDRARTRLNESERKTIARLRNLSPEQQEQLTQLWEQAAETFGSLIEFVLNEVVSLILKLIAAVTVVAKVVSYFSQARRIFERLFR